MFRSKYGLLIIPLGGFGILILIAVCFSAYENHQKAARHAEAEERDRASKAAYQAMSPEDKAKVDAENRRINAGWEEYKHQEAGQRVLNQLAAEEKAAQEKKVPVIIIAPPAPGYTSP
jgi:hypothetical protein